MTDVQTASIHHTLARGCLGAVMGWHALHEQATMLHAENKHPPTPNMSSSESLTLQYV